MIGEIKEDYYGRDVVVTEQLQIVIDLFAKLTDGERYVVMSDYCNHCGCNDPMCSCSNDE